MELEDCDLAIGLSLETDQRLTAHIYDFRLWGKALSVTDITNGRKVDSNPGKRMLSVRSEMGHNTVEI